jgi:hypothetical protein
MQEKTLKTVGFVLISIIVVGFFIFLLKLSFDRVQWLDEHCHQIGLMSGSIGFGPASGKDSGMSTVFIPGKTGYQCDNGMTYWE